MLAIHGRYYQKSQYYIISGYTVSKTYDSSYSEVLKVCKQFVNPVAIIDLKLTKVPKSALTNLETASFHCTVKFKKEMVIVQSFPMISTFHFIEEYINEKLESILLKFDLIKQSPNKIIVYVSKIN